MNIILKIWRVYRWIAIAIGTVLLLLVFGNKTYKHFTDPDEVPAHAAFIEQQLGLPCAGLTLSKAVWNKKTLCLSAAAEPTDAWVNELAAAGWVERHGLPGVRRVFERSGFTLALLTEKNQLLLYPTWIDRKGKTINTPEDVRKAS